jgi:uncharacterized protein (AIM24 family)
MEWDVHRTKGVGVMTGGLFNTLVQGQGMVALTSDGEPLLLDCSQQPTFVARRPPSAGRPTSRPTW